jgi:hypothetical protein
MILPMRLALGMGDWCAMSPTWMLLRAIAASPSIGMAERVVGCGLGLATRLQPGPRPRSTV